VRSMMIEEIPPLCTRARRYRRIFSSSTTLSAKSLSANQFESQPRIIPKRFPIGFVFCPILNYLLVVLNSHLNLFFLLSCYYFLYFLLILFVIQFFIL